MPSNISIEVCTQWVWRHTKNTLLETMLQPQVMIWRGSEHIFTSRRASA